MLQAFVTQVLCYSSLLSCAVTNGGKLQPNFILGHIRCVWVASTKPHHLSVHVQSLLFFHLFFSYVRNFP
jgi:hypothetical protein